MQLNHASLFTGYGAADLAADWVGWQTIFQSEINKYCRLILEKNFAGRGITLHGDIKQLDGKPYNGAIDIISGGDPCQPSSLQGKQKGVDDHRYLWPQKFRIIKEVQPAWVVNENVPGTIFNGILDRKISDLESEGYTGWPPIVIPGAAVGTIHLRERVFLVAYADGRRFQQLFATRITNKPHKRQLSKHPVITAPIGLKAGHTSVRSILRAADGSAERLAPFERIGGIHAGGNGIVPQVIYGIFKEIDRITTEYINSLTS